MHKYFKFWEWKHTNDVDSWDIYSKRYMSDCITRYVIICLNVNTTKLKEFIVYKRINNRLL